MRVLSNLACLTAAVLLFGCQAADEDTGELLDESELAVVNNSTLSSVTLTHYTLVTEAQTSGQHTGDGSIICGQGLSGCYHKEFLCSGWGVAMQGTGKGSDGKFIHFVSGGGGWNSNFTWLNNCSTATFKVVSGVTGASGRTLVDDYSIAVDPGVIPLGWYVWIDAQNRWYRADDTGGAIIGKHIDVYEGATGKVPNAGSSRVFITSTAHGSGDVSPYGGGTNVCLGRGDGSYCGGDIIAGDPKTLYRCSGGQVASAQVCANGCEWMPSGVPDQCNTSGNICSGHGDGLYCGGDGVAGNTSTLYQCAGGAVAKATFCASGCQYNPPGVPDQCK